MGLDFVAHGFDFVVPDFGSVAPWLGGPLDPGAAWGDSVKWPWAAASPIAWPRVSPSDTEGISYDRLTQIILKYVF